MKCTLCGYTFDENEAPRSCKGCPIMKGCKLIRCPNCSFETPREPRLPAWLSPAGGQAKLIKYLKKKGKVAMTKLDVNQKGKVAHINTHDHKKLQKIMAMGVLPGMVITLIQKFPSYVFQVGQSQFAVDKELASCIYVKLRD